jgi:hypothetical protein
VVAVGCGALLGVFGARRSEAHARPRILIESPAVERVSLPLSIAHVSTPGTALWSGSSEPPARIALIGRPGVLEIAGLIASFVGESGERSVVSLDPLNYVTRVDAVAGSSGGRAGWTVVAITGRATSRRLLIVVLSPDAKVSHSELLERCWPLDQAPLEKWSLQDGKGSELAVVPEGCEGPIGFRIR